jgi:hypothetical protein
MREEHDLSINLSQIILDAFKNDCIDDENILSFAFYLQMGLIKIMTNIDPDFINKLKSEFIMTSFDYSEKDKMSDIPAQNFDAEIASIDDDFEPIWQDFITHKKFEGNKEILLEIAKDIMETDSQSDLFPWLEKWLVICKNMIDSANQNNILTNGASTTSILESTYIRLMRAVYQHLGLSGQTNTIVTYFVQRILGLINPPNIIIMGAQKCGTTTLHHSLLAHSKINGPVNPESNKNIKEVDFFNKKLRNGLSWYFSHFSSANGLFLDSSPNYLTSPGCFSLMPLVVPNSKIIICLRDPVYRAYSAYNHYSQKLPRSAGINWSWKHDKDFLTNIKIELQDINTKLHQSPNALESETLFSGFILRGVYIHQITQLLNYYDRSQIYISITDRWHLNYENELDNILTFLELEKEEILPIIKHKREYTVEPFNDEAKEILTEFYKPYNQKLFEFLGYEIPEWRH